MFQQYQDRVGFLFVYIQEAHPEDEWQMDSNVDVGVVFAQPITFASRQEVARQCTGALSLTMPCVVDDMANTVDEAYSGWPERLFVIGADSTIAYAGGMGPFNFEPDEVEAWLREHVGPPAR